MVVPVDVHWLIIGARPLVKVRIGHGRAIPVLLDTGSVGLRVYAPAVKAGPSSGVTLTSQSDTQRFADGTVEQGVVGHARVTIGSLSTTDNVPFTLVSRISCMRAIPDCPGADGIRGFNEAGEYGILGIGLRRPANGVTNPLLSLPAPYSRTWSVELTEAGGSLVLRPHPDSGPFAIFQLRPDGPAVHGAPAWKDDHAKVCWAEVDLRGDACEPTLFDTGSTTMIWYGGLLGRSNTSITRVFVNQGEYIAAWKPGSQSPFWTFTSGSEFSHDTVIALRGGHPLVIADVQAFLKFDVVYDAAHGRIALHPQGSP